jgi:hypothetical protein
MDSGFSVSVVTYPSLMTQSNLHIPIGNATISERLPPLDNPVSQCGLCEVSCLLFCAYNSSNMSRALVQ